MWNSQNVQLKHEKSNSMSIVLQPNPNCIDRKQQQLYSDLEILSKYTTQTCNSTFGKKKKYVWFVTFSQIIIWLTGHTKHPNEQIFGDQINELSKSTCRMENLKQLYTLKLDKKKKTRVFFLGHTFFLLVFT